MKQISDYLETNNQKFVEELIEYLRFPSVSAQSKHKIDMTNCAQWLASHGRSIGLKTKVHKTSGHPIVTLTTKQKTNGNGPWQLLPRLSLILIVNLMINLYKWAMGAPAQNQADIDQNLNDKSTLMVHGSYCPESVPY